MIDYRCQCGARPGKDKLVAMRVDFLTVGRNPRKIQSRVVAWLCPACVQKEPAWNKEKYTSPGIANAGNGEVTNATG